MSKISETLYKAAEHIEAHGWWQGYFWPTPDLSLEPPYIEGDPCCVLGAIAVAEGVDPVHEDTEAMKYLAEHIGLKGGSPFTGSARAADWNDMGERTKEEVLAALRGAALRAERAGK